MLRSTTGESKNVERQHHVLFAAIVIETDVLEIVAVEILQLEIGRLIAGLEEIDSGTVSISGQIVNKLDPRDRDVTMVFQNNALYRHMTVCENLEFPLKLRKIPKSQIRGRAQEAAELLGIAGLLERKPDTLSGGVPSG